MKHPAFFSDIEPIILQDKLAHFLGAFENGIIEFHYLDVVKSAGHSCPTVAGAFLMTREGLKALYPQGLPQRGEILVSFKEDINDGVTGVIANIVTQITGATEHHGFKGIGGQFARYGLMQFQDDIPSNIRFQRKDTGETVDVYYDPTRIPVDPLQPQLMQKIKMGTATTEDKISFAELWQKRVEQIFNDVESVIKVT